MNIISTSLLLAIILITFVLWIGLLLFGLMNLLERKGQKWKLWALFILFVPIIGVLVYMIFGRKKKIR